MFIDLEDLSSKGDMKLAPLSFILYSMAIMMYFKGIPILTASWSDKMIALHIVLETIYIFLMVLIVAISWFTRRCNQVIDFLMGAGLFFVAIYNALYLYFLPSLKLCPVVRYDLSMNFWLIGRIIEATIIYAGTLNIFFRKISRSTALLLSFIIAVVISAGVFFLPNLFKLFSQGQSVNMSTKICFVSALIVCLMLSVNSLIKIFSVQNILTYKYCCLVILSLMITEGLYLLVFGKCFCGVVGHGIRIICCYYLLDTVFANCMVKPLKRLEYVNSHIRRVVDEMPLGLITFSKNGELLLVNQKAVELTGWSLVKISRFFQHQALNMFTNSMEDNNKLRQICPKYERSNMITDIVTITDSQGIKKRLSIDKHSLVTGEVILILGERTKEKEFENLQIQTQGMINSISNIVLICDKKRNIVMCNKLFNKTAELNEEEVVGTNIKDLTNILQFDKKRFHNKKRKKPYYPVTIITAKGRRKELLMHLSPIYGLDGATMGYAIIASDITGLSNRCDKTEQTGLLALLGQQSATIVHETKNYLATIKGYCQLLKTITQDTRVKEYVQKIDRGIEEANKTIVEFLMLAKSTTHSVELISLNELLKSMKESLEVSFWGRGITVNMELTQQERLVRCDREQIRRAILNICINAAEAVTSYAQPLLTLKTQFNSTTSEMLVIVSDNGCGIAEKDIPFIGTPFFTTKENGTGLGLTVCYKIIRDYGGTIRVNSVPQKGTEFTISLPCYTDNKCAVCD